MIDIERSLAESANNLANRMAFWAEHRATLRPIADLVHDRWPEADFDVAATNMDISFSGSIGDLMGAITLLQELGYEPASEEPKETTSYWSSYFNKEGAPKLWLHWSNRFCERVQVGTRTEEVPVYEMRCREA